MDTLKQVVSVKVCGIVLQNVRKDTGKLCQVISHFSETSASLNIS